MLEVIRMTELEFSLLWDNIIVPEANIIAYDSNVFFAENLKDAIYLECSEMINHCKLHYMESSDKYIDRHKIAAAIMIGILKHTPLKIIGAIYYTSPNKVAFNEHLAITVGLSILRAFIEADLHENYKNNSKYQVYLSQIENGIVLPKAKHGDYRNNWANELYYTRKNGNYNILSLAHELYFLELNTIVY